MAIRFRGVLRSEYYKYRKSTSYVITYVAMIVYCIVFALLFLLVNDDADMGSCLLNVLSNSVLMNMLVSILIIPYAINDFQHRTIQHAITLGVERRMIVNAKLLLPCLVIISAYLIGMLMGGLCIYLFFSKTFVKISFSFIVQAILAEVVFIIAYIFLCMSLYMILKSSAAYIMMIFSLWFSMAGSIAGKTIENPFLAILARYNIFGQNHLMICQRMGDEIYMYSAEDWIKYLIVMGSCGVVLYVLIRKVFSKTEIR